MYDWAYDLVIRVIDWGGYGGVFLLLLFETMFPPMPSEIILPIAGMRAASGPLGLPGVIFAGTAGSMTGNYLWYRIARAIGMERLHLFVTRHGRWLGIDWDDVEKVQRLFDRHGAGTVFTARLLPAVRTFISIPAGIVAMPLTRYMLWSTAGTLGWSALLAGAGYGLGVNYREIETIAGPLTTAIVMIFAAWYLWRQLTWSRRVARRADARGGTRP
jgi:membrane protein DedA with SNARE-associated domain